MPALVTICIPCFNAGRWLAGALDSAFTQTWPHCEVILVDDGSTDNSLEIARRYEPQGLRILRQANLGQCAACNLAWRSARGDYIKFLDADDVLAPEAIALQLAALEGRPGHLAHGTWARFFGDDPSEAVFTPRPGWHDGEPLAWIKETWANTEPMYQCALFLIPRDLLRRVGGWDERLSLINDFEFFTRLILNSDGLVFVPGARLYYRSRVPGSLSAQKGRRAWQSACLSTTLAVEHLLQRENSPKTRRLSANMLQKLMFSFYPEHPDLRRGLDARIASLGGSELLPGGGASFQWMTRLVGWRLAARIRYLLGRRPA